MSRRASGHFNPYTAGLFGVGANGFVFEPVTDDRGAGALWGAFRGRTAGIGPVVSYIRPLGKTALAYEPW